MKDKIKLYDDQGELIDINDECNLCYTEVAYIPTESALDEVLAAFYGAGVITDGLCYGGLLQWSDSGMKWEYIDSGRFYALRSAIADYDT